MLFFLKNCVTLHAQKGEELKKKVIKSNRQSL